MPPERAIIFGTQDNRFLLPPLVRATFRHAWRALYRNLTVVDTMNIPFSLDRVVLETLEAVRDAALRLGKAHVIALCRWDGQEHTRPTPHHILKSLLSFDAVSNRPDITIKLTPAFETALGHARARAHPTPTP